MVESSAFSLFFLVGLLFGNIGGAFLPSDVYLSFLNYGNITFVSSVGTVATTAPIDVVMSGGERYELIRQSWNKVDPAVSDTIIYLTSCSMGLLVGGNIGHKIRVKVTEPLKEIGDKCSKLVEKLETEKEKLNEIKEKTVATEIKGIIGYRNNDGVVKLNSDSIKLVREMKSLVDKHNN
ncbi:MAG: hypothetical protein MRERV_12c042 [Mycoplasmataceae bacterium RV_VA103A]|nr:MAG: hypothetical protein MRERV_12c042 [Mycoplasmataceae bacterium RV_VA103A]